MSDGAAPAEGARVGDYVLEAPLGSGGMGSVYRARHQRLGAARALKVVTLSGPRAAVRAERFQREARILAKLDHPGVVRVHEHGLLQGGASAFCALELVEGRDLARLLEEEGPLGLPRLLRAGSQVARALAHVHRAGVVHRDLKPANVLLRAEDDAAVLSDFGIARDEAEERLTLTGQVLGTALYMAPEQAWGDRGEVGPWSDVFSLGALLYECASGQPPFAGDGYLAIGRAMLAADYPRLRRLRPQVPRGLEQVVDLCLAPDAAQRPQAAEVADALEALARGERPALVGGGRGRLLVPGALLALALLGGGIALALRWRAAGAERAAQAARVAAAVDELTPVWVAYEEAAQGWRLGLRARPDPAAARAALARVEPLAAEEGSFSEAGTLRGGLAEALEQDALQARGPAALPQVRRLPATARQARVEGALLAAAGTPAALARLEELRDGAAGPTRAELTVQAAACAITAGELARGEALLGELRPDQLPGQRLVAARLARRLRVGRAVERARALDGRGAARILIEVAERDPGLVAEGVAEAGRALAAEVEAGADPEAALVCLETLRRVPGGAAALPPQAARVYLACAGSQAELPRLHRLLLRATELDPSGAGLSRDAAAAWLLYASQELAQGRGEAALEVVRRAVRAGHVGVLSPFVLEQLFTQGHIDRVLEDAPDDWTLRYLRAVGLREVASSQETARERRAARRDVLGALRWVLEQEGVPPLVRSDVGARELDVLKDLDHPDFRRLLDQRLEEGWIDKRELFLRALRHALDEELPAEALEFSRRYMEATEERVAQSAAGEVPEGVERVMAPHVSLAYAWEQRFEAFVLAERADDAEAALAELVHLRPGYDRQGYRRAQLLNLRGDVAGARALLEKYLVDADDETAQEFYERLPE